MRKHGLVLSFFQFSSANYNWTFRNARWQKQNWYFSSLMPCVLLCLYPYLTHNWAVLPTLLSFKFWLGVCGHISDTTPVAKHEVMNSVPGNSLTDQCDSQSQQHCSLPSLPSPACTAMKLKCETSSECHPQICKQSPISVSHRKLPTKWCEHNTT